VKFLFFGNLFTGSEESIAGGGLEFINVVMDADKELLKCITGSGRGTDQIKMLEKESDGKALKLQQNMTSGVSCSSRLIMKYPFMPMIKVWLITVVITFIFGNAAIMTV
jgi:uncharacterized membrane protein (DUF106 family)